MTTVRIFRIYASLFLYDGIVEETYKLKPFRSGGQRYDGFKSVDDWSQHNKTFRPGCCQLVVKNNKFHFYHMGYLKIENLMDSLVPEMEKRYPDLKNFEVIIPTAHVEA